MLSVDHQQRSAKPVAGAHGGFEWLLRQRRQDPSVNINSDATYNTGQARISPSHIPRLRSQGSLQSVRSHDTAISIGIPSIEQPHNNSTTSLASSKVGGMDRNPRKRPSRDALSEQVNRAAPNISKGGLGVFSGASKYLRPSKSRQSLKEGDAGRIWSKKSSAPFGLLQIQSSHSPRLSPSSPDSAKSSGSTNLSGHLIPSRTSSLRHGSSERPHIRESKRLSSSSHDLKSLNIDQDLIEEDDSTVRRIRELQDAKDKRQQEWRREARRSEKSKRNSMPGQKVLQKPISHQISHSVAGILMEVPDQEAGHASSQSATSSLRNPKTASAATTPTAYRSTVAAQRSQSILNRHDSVRTSHGSPEVQAPALPKHGHRLSSTLRRSVTTNSIFLETSDALQGSVDDEIEVFLNSPRFTQKIKHPRTDRIIAFSEVGDPDGFPVICCVGMGLTRYLTAFYDELARTLKLRLITPDRPGIGGSEPCPDGQGTPLNWADDVYVLCKHLEITKFSLLAHSAGSIYALATALRLPQYVRGRIHLLAPWIPPSQIASSKGWSQPPPGTEVPFTHKLLSVLPASFLKVANASFMSATSASISPKARSKRRSGLVGLEEVMLQSSTPQQQQQQSSPPMSKSSANVSCYQAQTTTLVESGFIPSPPPILPPPSTAPSSTQATRPSAITTAMRRALYDETLTHRIWELATTNANPAVDLLVCLERRAPIGFKYIDVTRAVVIHHGSEDMRVSIEMTKWIGQVMKRCEVRVLEGEGHGLMANATVMAGVLGEVGKEWEEWKKVVEGKEREEKERAKKEREAKEREGKGGANTKIGIR